MLSLVLAFRTRIILNLEIFQETKVWSEKKFPHVCRYYMNSFSFCENSFKSVKSRHSELSKMVRHFIFTEKMTPIVGTGSRNKNSDFTNFVKFFCEIKVPKWQSRKSQNLSVLLKFFTFKHLKMIENHKFKASKLNGSLAFTI